MHAQLPLFPEAASTFAGNVDRLYFFLVLLTFLVAFGIAGAIAYFLARYHRQSPESVGEQIEGSTPLEVTWIAIPTLISLCIFAWGASVYFTLYHPPKNALDVYVIGKQWMWKFQHQEGQRELNVLHVPAGRDIRLIMGSEDVIHSFFVPAFRTKADLVPGMYRTLWFNSPRPGVYPILCAEYCGTSHSAMRGAVVVMPPAEYQTWLAQGGAEGPGAARGEKLFLQLGCGICHRADSQGRGPVLAGLFGKQVLLDNGETVTADEAYLRESILVPAAKVVSGFQPLMPTFQGLVTEDDLLDLIAYVRSVGARSPIEPPAPEVP